MKITQTADMESRGPVQVLVVTGPSGVGKTSVAAAIAAVLRGRAIGHACIDPDELRNAFPHPVDDPGNERLALANLAAVWPNFQRNGAQCLLLPMVVESRDAVKAIASSIPDSRLLVVRLQAPLIVIRERLQSREQGTALTGHLQRAAELMDVLDRNRPEDITIGTEGRTVPEVATDIIHHWLPERNWLS